MSLKGVASTAGHPAAPPTTDRRLPTFVGPWGQAIRLWLVARNQRSADLARATGISSKAIASITRGNHTTTRALLKIAAALDVPLSELFVAAPDERRRLIVEITQAVVAEVDKRVTVAQAADAFARSVEAAERAAVPPPGSTAHKERRGNK